MRYLIHRLRFASLGMAALAALALAGPAGAITYGVLDGDLHPEVGAIVANVGDGVRDWVCSGTLLSPTVFLTAAHCMTEGERVWVTFAADADDLTGDETLHAGAAHVHPLFGTGGQNDPHDIAVVVLDEPVIGVMPAALPTAGLLGGINLRAQTFTAVGYGGVRETNKTGPHAIFYDGLRRYGLQTFQSRSKAWLNLSMQPSTGDAGTCFGDSGGPHFLGDVRTHLVVAITVTGDAVCRATDRTYRLDTAESRDFLGNYVALP